MIPNARVGPLVRLVTGKDRTSSSDSRISRGRSAPVIFEVFRVRGLCPLGLCSSFIDVAHEGQIIAMLRPGLLDEVFERTRPSQTSVVFVEQAVFVGAVQARIILRTGRRGEVLLVL